MTFKERFVRFRSFWIFPLVGGVLLYLTSQGQEHGRSKDLLWLVPIGIFIWTILEYGLHRFLFHIQIPIPNPHVREIVNGSHMLHHASPRDPGKILVHPAYGLVISAILYSVLLGLFPNAFSATGVMVGIWVGFLYYEAVHYRVHFSLSESGFVARQRRRHFYHHFTNNKLCFGVTSPLWDYVFRTTLPQR